jgi:hypothetical protein
MKKTCFLFIALLSSPPLFSASEVGSIRENAPTRPIFRAELYSWGYSSPFSHLNGRTASPAGVTEDPVQIINQITLATPAFGNFDFEITPQFVLQPFEGSRFQVLDPSIGFEGTLFDTGVISYWARYEVLAPVSSKSREIGLLLAPQAIQTVTFSAPSFPLKAEIWLSPTLSLFQNGETALSLYVSPRLIYSLSDSFSLFALLELGLVSERSGSLLQLDISSDPTAGFGFRYASDSGKGLWVQPFIDFFPGGDLASNAHLGVFFGGPLL